ncbi:hypothetical protein [Pseudomonas vranovensis]|nr:hypothetical protein [Pseudomonas vranovensis]
MRHPLTLGESQALSYDDEALKPMLRETYRYPSDTPDTQRSSLRRQAIQRIDDVVMFHRFAMFTHTQSNEVITPAFEKFNEHYNYLFNDMGDDVEKISTARLAFRNYDAVAQLRQVECIANESLVINLWATIEQFSNRCLAMMSRESSTKQASHKWDSIEREFEKLEVSLKNAISYSVIDELRVLNNKIKHSYLVDEKLGEFEFFKSHINKRIDLVPLRVFDYVLAAHSFVCYITNRSGASEFYPENEEDDEE